MALDVELIDPSRRPAVLAATPRVAGWPVGRRAAYSEVFGWYLLGRVLEAVSGQEIGEHLRESVLRPCGLDDTWIGMTPDEYERVLPRLGMNIDLRGHQPFPLVLERGARMCAEVNPAHGGYTTAGDLARFYALLAAQLGGANHDFLPSADTLRQFTTSDGPARLDEVLGRECEYGLGFMTALAGHAFGRWCSPASFGHSGHVGSSFAFADPAADLAVAVIYNGITDHESAFLRRPVVVRAIYTDLGLADAPTDEPSVPAPEAHHQRRRFGRRRR
jgi:CubicO group peptidase (beta-lactamase class C family)